MARGGAGTDRTHSIRNNEKVNKKRPLAAIFKSRNLPFDADDDGDHNHSNDEGAENGGGQSKQLEVAAGEPSTAESNRELGDSFAAQRDKLAEVEVAFSGLDGKEEDAKSESGGAGKKVLQQWMIKQGMNLKKEQRGEVKQEAQMDGGSSSGFSDDKKIVSEDDDKKGLQDLGRKLWFCLRFYGRGSRAVKFSQNWCRRRFKARTSISLLI